MQTRRDASAGVAGPGGKQIPGAQTAMTGGIEWRDGVPWSSRYGDVFFASESGLAESRHVFLEGNRLAQRFAALPRGGLLSIGETGFGTGLNFVAAWHLFREQAPDRARLCYTSVELHPLTTAELRQALAPWRELAREADELVSRWQDFVPGFHRLTLDGGRVVLTLLVGDAAAVLSELDARIDAWFLDGFAPDRNPAMWSEALFGEIARCSHADSTFATFTVAGSVRRALALAGFAVEKRQGFGRKREMLAGARIGQAETLSVRPPVRSVAVVGAGLAGAAAALAARGLSVTVVDRHPDIAAGASGNPQGVLYVRLSRGDTPLRRLLLASYQHTVGVLPALLPEDGERWQRCGVLQLAFDAEEERRQEGLLQAGIPSSVVAPVSVAQAEALAGVPVPSGGLHFPGGGWVHPASLCAALLHGHPGIKLSLGYEVRTLVHDDGCALELHDAASRREMLHADAVVLAAALDTRAFLDALPMRPIAGQITTLAATSLSQRLCTVLCGRGYVAPARLGRHTLGATHRLNDTTTDLRDADHAHNLAVLRALAPAIASALPSGDTPLAGRTGVRCTSPDTLPIVGAVAQERLHVTTAHGSRGLVTTLLAGEIIASALAGEPPPLGRELLQRLSPLRFRRPHAERALWHHRGHRKTEESA